MRLRALHDSHGNITALAVSPPDATPVQIIEMQPGQQVGQRMTEVEAPPEVTLEIGGPRLNEDLSDLMQNYIVEITEDKGRLSRRSD
jgi:hypothetical protein